MCKSPETNTSSDTLVLKKTISTSKYPVLLASCPAESTDYVIKAYTKDSSSRSSYLREKQILSSVRHPNIINYVPDSRYRVKIPHRNCIMMEYAPHGDFFNLIINKHIKNEKIIRTYFHQLVEGLEHLHSHGIAHLDIKLENLLLGKDLLLKIADFDVSQALNDENLLSQGTENYRAPEVRDGTSKDYTSADVYSAGVCLFTLISRAFPFMEGAEGAQVQSYEEFSTGSDRYWKGIEKMFRKKVVFSESLKELLNGMWAKNEEERMSLDEVKRSRWYNEPIYSQEELRVAVQEILGN